jgi:hypothetical protein
MPLAGSRDHLQFLILRFLAPKCFHRGKGRPQSQGHGRHLWPRKARPSSTSSFAFVIVKLSFCY